MDIQGASRALSQIAPSGLSGASESAANVTKIAEDSSVERKQAERADAGPNVGKKVDVDA